MRRALPLLLIPILVVWLAATSRPAADIRYGLPGAITTQQRTGAPSDPAVAQLEEHRPAPEATGAEPVRGVKGGAPHPTGGIGEPLSYCKPQFCETPQPRIVDGISIAGTASWYRYVPGGAAAGPALRRFLGPHWRGGIVRVCVLLGGRATTNCVVAALNDWCACDTGAEKLIDLDAQLFAALAPLSQGVVTVEVRAIR